MAEGNGQEMSTNLSIILPFLVSMTIGNYGHYGLVFGFYFSFCSNIFLQKHACTPLIQNILFAS